MESTFHLQGWGPPASETAMTPGIQHCFAKREKGEKGSCRSYLSAVHHVIHHHIFLHWLVIEKQIKSRARWAPCLCRLGCKRGCLCQSLALCWACVNCCVTVSSWLCFETGSAAAAPSPVLFGAKQRRVIVGHFERSSFVAVCLRMRWVTGRLHAVSAWVWIRGKAPGLLAIVSVSGPPNCAFHRAGGCDGLLVLWVLLKGGWAILFCSTSW